MKRSRILRLTALVSASVAALSLAACNRTGSTANGAYVPGSTNSTLPETAGGQPALPPRSEYQSVADTPPPPMPVYDQPPIPGPGYLWSPGYWDWSDSDDDYYWVPGTWVEPPEPGMFWTPGYWRYYNGYYLYSQGYWGPQVGFYGGVDYGYGYDGQGYEGGRWQGRQFYYNSAANNLGSRGITTVYSQGVHRSGNPTSYNGGPHGLRSQPGQADIQASQAPHAPPTRGQIAQARTARTEPQLRASVNRGSPPIAATARSGEIHLGDAGVTAARSAATYQPPAGQGRGAGGALVGGPGLQGREPEAPRTVGGRPSTAPAQSVMRQPESTRPQTAGPAGPLEHTVPMARTSPTERPPPIGPMTPSQTSSPSSRFTPMERSAPVERTAPTPRASPIERAAPVQRAPVQRSPTPQVRPAPQVHLAAPRPATPAPAARPAPEQKHSPPDHPGL